MPGNRKLVAMRRADGAMDSEVHLDGLVVKPDETGVVQIPAEFVMSMLNAGYEWSSLSLTP